PIRAAYLIESRARPDTAGQRLVEQPAIQQHIHGRLGCGDLYGTEHIVPPAADVTQDSVQVCGAVTAEQLAYLFPIFRLAQEEHDFRARAGTQLKLGLQRGAWIETGTHPSGKVTASLKGRGTFGRAIATQKLRAVARAGSLPPGKIRKGDAAAEFAAPRAPRKERSRLRIDFRDDVRGRSAARAAEHPLGIGGYREATGAAGIILQNEPRDLYRVFGRHELNQLKQDAVRAMLEAAVALAVARHIRSSF